MQNLKMGSKYGKYVCKIGFGFDLNLEKVRKKFRLTVLLSGKVFLFWCIVYVLNVRWRFSQFFTCVLLLGSQNVKVKA